MKSSRAILVVVVIAALLVAGLAVLRLPPSSLPSAGGRLLLRGGRNGQQLAVAGADIEHEIDVVAGIAEEIRTELDKEPLAPDLPERDIPTFVPREKMLDETMFISIASFRDVLCQETVHEMFSKARNPVRVFMGIIQQHGVEEPHCIPKPYRVCSPTDDFCPMDNIRMRYVEPHNAKGPCFGRFVSMLMYRMEKYYMMIDSHNRFMHHWDTVLLKMYDRTPTKRAVLSHYPNGYNEGKPLQTDVVMVMCKVHWTPFHFPRLGARWMPTRPVPYLQPFAAAGFVFADAAMVHEVPFDPHLDFLFDGEEILYTVRMWTHGWDIYGPSIPILFHNYERHTAKRFWHEKIEWGPIQAVSQKRVQLLLKSTLNNSRELLVTPESAKHMDPRVTRELDKFGLGTVRTLEQFYQYARINLTIRSDGESLCDDIQRGKA